MTKSEKDMLDQIFAEHTLVIVLGQTDRTHYMVLYGNAPRFTAKRFTAPQIVSHVKCHFSSDFGMLDIRHMFTMFDSYRYILQDYPQETILTVADFMNGRQPNITEWMTPKEFKQTVFELSAVADATSYKTYKKYRDQTNKVIAKLTNLPKLPDANLRALAEKFVNDGKDNSTK